MNKFYFLDLKINIHFKLTIPSLISREHVMYQLTIHHKV